MKRDRVVDPDADARVHQVLQQVVTVLGADYIQVEDVLDSANSLIASLLPGLFKGRFLPGFVLQVIQILIIKMFAKKR